MINLYQQWIDLKEAEKQATEARREVEDKLIQIYRVPESLDGTENFENKQYLIKIVGRLNRKVDTDKLQELAAEHGLIEHLSSLFRWKAEVNAAVWKASNETITQPLLDAITTSASRPSFSITIKE